MPRISQCHGVDISMYYADHLPPHFHAYHGDDEVLVEWSPPQVYRGSLSPKTLKRVLEWAGLHPTELDEDWQLARSGLPLKPIPPLP